MSRKNITVILFIVAVIVLSTAAFIFNKQKSLTVESKQILQESTRQPERIASSSLLKINDLRVNEAIEEQPKKILEIKGVITAVNEGSVEVDNNGVRTIIPLTGKEDLIVRSPIQ